MTPSEWLRVCDQVNKLWPGQPWKAGTADEAAALFVDVSARAGHEAVRELAMSGREFSPPPGVLLRHAEAIEATLRPALPSPELTRDLTPAEQQRASEMAVRLRERIATLAAAKAAKAAK